ncbi:MAG: Gx transporter family protein [Clostridia bacterium]|nr:Gx transporter family protein [Clostridia bacterium]
MNKTRRVTILAIMVSQALILSIIESWIPIPFIIPGIKLGLANVVTLVVLIFFGAKDALLVVAMRCVLASIFGGGPVMFLFSIAGGVLSALTMALLHKKMSKYFSLVGMSVAGSVMHNIGQLTIASIIMRDIHVLTYLPVLLVSGVIMGFFVGVCGNFLVSALRKTGKLS